MKLMVKMFEKEFSAETGKKAYLKACKWVAKNMLGGKKAEDLGEMACSYKKLQKDFPTFLLEVHAVYDDEILHTSFCKKCTEYHHAFFINENTNCNSCNMVALRGQQLQQLEGRKTYAKNKIESSTPK